MGVYRGGALYTPIGYMAMLYIASIHEARHSMGACDLSELWGRRLEWLAPVANLRRRLTRIASRSEESSYERPSRCIFDKRDH